MCSSAARGSTSTTAAVKLCVPGFVSVCALCMRFLCQVSSLCLDRPGQPRLPVEHAAAKYTHISKCSTTTDRVLLGWRGAGNRSKGEVRERQRGVHTGKQKKKEAGGRQRTRKIETLGQRESGWQQTHPL